MFIPCTSLVAILATFRHILPLFTYKKGGCNHGYLRCKAHQGTKASWGLEAQVFLSETHHMSNIYFVILMMVVSYFYMTFSQFLHSFN